MHAFHMELGTRMPAVTIGLVRSGSWGAEALFVKPRSTSLVKKICSTNVTCIVVGAKHLDGFEVLAVDTVLMTCFCSQLC